MSVKGTLCIVTALVLLAACGRTRPAVSTLERGGGAEPSPGAPRASVDSTPLALVETDTVTIPGTEVSFTMALIPGGSFTMGSPESEAGRDADEGPQRTVTVEPFWMGVYEVTYDEFAIFRYRDRDSDATAAGGSSFSADAVARPSPPYEDPAHGMGNQGFPAAGMTQWGALQYARWLSDKTGDLYRLPTEAEWEFACRAGSTTAYAFGDDPAGLDAYAWYYGNSDEVFHEVGQKAPNAWGLYDMHGNVSEWTLDQYDAAFYASLPEEASSPWAQPTRLHPRTVRGGAYDDDPEALRCADRLESTLNWKRRDPQIPKSFWWNTDSPFVGFRLVRPANPPAPEDIEAFWALVLGG
jgi:formylglycine-generating enzyme required for sulfatase activity